MTSPFQGKYLLSVMDVACILIIAGFSGAFIGVQWASWYLSCPCR